MALVPSSIVRDHDESADYILEVVASFEASALDHWPHEYLAQRFEASDIDTAWQHPRCRSILIRLAAAAGDTSSLSRHLNTLDTEPRPVTQTATAAILAALLHGKREASELLLRFFSPVLSDTDRAFLAAQAYLNGMAITSTNTILHPWAEEDRASILAAQISILDMETMVARGHGLLLIDLLQFLNTHEVGPRSRDLRDSQILYRAIQLGDTTLIANLIDFLAYSPHDIASSLDGCFLTDNSCLLRWLRYTFALSRDDLDTDLVARALRVGALDCALTVANLLDWTQSDLDDCVVDTNPHQPIIEALALRRFAHPRTATNWPSLLWGSYGHTSVRDILGRPHSEARTTPSRTRQSTAPPVRLSETPGRSLEVSRDPASSPIVPPSNAAITRRRTLNLRSSAGWT